MMRIQDAGLRGSLIGRVREDVPATEHHLVEFLQRHKLFDQRCAALGALAKTNGAKLGHRADGLCVPLPDQVHSCHEGCADGTHAGCQNAELALGRRNLGWSAHAEILDSFWKCYLIARRLPLQPAREKTKLSMMREALRICNAEKKMVLGQFPIARLHRR